MKRHMTRQDLEAAIKKAFGDTSPYLWGEHNEIDWGDGWWTSIVEFIGKDSEENASYTYFQPDEKEINKSVLPLVYDSPHSGFTLPKDFQFDCDVSAIRRCSDSHMDSIIQDAVLKGIDVLKANFPRAYIDPNRAESCITPEQFKGGLSEERLKTIDGDPRAPKGYGLIWMKFLGVGSASFYAKGSGKRPTEKDLEHRLENYYRPYHKKLAQLIKDKKEKFGFVYHIDWHSCPRYGSTLHTDSGKKRADFILGDRRGTTFDPVLLNGIKEFLEKRGYSVALNAPYQGAELIQRHGKPEENQHSLQIEIVRDLYMDEITHEPHKGIRDITATVQDLSAYIADYVRKKTLENATKPFPRVVPKTPKP